MRKLMSAIFGAVLGLSVVLGAQIIITPPGGGGGGGGTIGGSIASGQVAVGSGADTIGGSTFASVVDSSLVIGGVLDDIVPEFIQYADEYGAIMGVGGADQSTERTTGIVGVGYTTAISPDYSRGLYAIAGTTDNRITTIESDTFIAGAPPGDPTDLGGYYGYVELEAGATVGGQFALIYLDTPVLGAGATLGTLYGIHLADMTGASNNWAIKTGAGKVEFGDTVKAAGYLSSDGSAGVTTSAGIKNGLLTDQSAVAISGTMTAASFSASGTDAGALDLTQGTLPGAFPANTVSILAPTSVGTSYQITLPGAVPGGNGYALTATTGGVASWAAVGSPVLRGVTGSIGGGALAAGQCATGNATVTGATTAMAASASPSADPDPSLSTGVVWDAFVASANTVTVRVCGLVIVTPSATTYQVAVNQ